MSRIRKPNSKRAVPEYYHKVLVKTIRESELSWTHFCYVRIEAWEAFSKTTGCVPCEFGAWLANWAKEDFGMYLRMAKYEDLLRLKKAILVQYNDQYRRICEPELDEHKEQKTNVIKDWTTKHLLTEAVRYE